MHSLNSIINRHKTCIGLYLRGPAERLICAVFEGWLWL